MNYYRIWFINGQAAQNLCCRKNTKIFRIKSTAVSAELQGAGNFSAVFCRTADSQQHNIGENRRTAQPKAKFCNGVAECLAVKSKCVAT